jgi:hypothetical protein
MQLRMKMASITSQLFTIISISLVFGLLAFLFSILGSFEQTKNFTRLGPIYAVKLQEIGGHFLFGFIVGTPSRNLKIATLTGLMALTIDFDHLLFVAGSQTQSRIAHSISFAIVSSILISLLATKIYQRISSAPKEIMQYENPDRKSKKNRKLTIIPRRDALSLFFLISLAAFLSHIAYDVFIDDRAKFPLLAPFLFSQFIIPRVYGLPIEMAGFLSLMLFYIYSNTRYPNNNKGVSYIELARHF